jgi:exopolysaccharide biosynthesis polyprenyl glycosylphosphotransferase
MSVITSDSYVSKLFTETLTASDIRLQRTISRKQFLRALAVCEFATDLLTCAAVMFAVELLQLYFVGSATYPINKIVVVSAIAGLFAAALLQRNRSYNECANLHPISEAIGAVRMSLQALVFILPTSFLLRPDLPRRAIILSFVLMPPLLMLQKHVFFLAIQKMHDRSYGTERVVIYGAGETGRRIASTLLSSPRLALRPVAVIDENSRAIDNCSLELAYRECSKIDVQCTSVTLDLLKSLQCNLLVIATMNLSGEQRDRLETVARQSGSRVAYASEARLETVQQKECLEIGGLLLTHERTTAIPWGYVFGKRMLDLIVSSLLLVLFSPVFLLIALLIRLSSRGPALFIQKRVGRGGRIFRMYKFRSMSCHARKYECSPKMSSDPRITGIGRFLRRISLDELPQLINVFLGQMSLVGPRPEMPFIVRQYNTHQRQRLQVIPGITGLWQLSADRAYPIHENLHHDLSYIRHRTLSMDLAILIHTLFFAMRGGV